MNVANYLHIDLLDLLIEDGDFPQQNVSLPFWANYFSPHVATFKKVDAYSQAFGESPIVPFIHQDMFYIIHVSHISLHIYIYVYTYIVYFIYITLYPWNCALAATATAYGRCS